MQILELEYSSGAEHLPSTWGAWALILSPEKKQRKKRKETGFDFLGEPSRLADARASSQENITTLSRIFSPLVKHSCY
jgi:hypothetical protein